MRTNRTANPRVPGNTSPRVKKDGFIRFIPMAHDGAGLPRRRTLARQSLRRPRSSAALLGALATLLIGAPAAHACVNDALRAPNPNDAQLPDCRAYELVSPVDKGGSDMTGGASAVAASPDGSRITYLAPTNMPGAVGAYGTPSFLSIRASESWSTVGMLLPTPPGSPTSIAAWNETLDGVALVGAAGGGPPGIYLTNGPGSHYSLIAEGDAEARVAGVTPDAAHVIFESSVQLLPNAAPGKTNLYEWSAATGVRLAGLLPGAGEVAPLGGSFAGPTAWLQGATETGGVSADYYTQGAISEDGSRVFFTAGEMGQLYVREDGQTTPIPGGHFDAANGNGSRVVVDDGGTLSEYDVASGVAQAVTPSESEVQGVVGMSSDGSYIYYVANAVLAENTGALGHKATPGTCSALTNLTGGVGSCNLYVSHNDGESWEPPQYIATLDSESETQRPPDSRDWYPTPKPNFSGGDSHEKTARVTPDGLSLLFASQDAQTSAEVGGRIELYRYDATDQTVSCVSCNLQRVVPTGDAALQSIQAESAAKGGGSGEPIITRNLSDDGTRAFFETPDALIPQDTNGVLDVYEWELLGAGSCQATSATFDKLSGGCLYLISTGKDPRRSFFGDASSNGSDVFIFTRQQLVKADGDELTDVYDARVDGGIAAQEVAPPVPCSDDSCHHEALSPPATSSLATAVNGPSGNVQPASSTKPPSKPASKPAASKSQLAAALRKCMKRPRSQRARCRAQAHKRFGPHKKAKRSTKKHSAEKAVARKPQAHR
jgi:hypothetical protein